MAGIKYDSMAVAFLIERYWEDISDPMHEGKLKCGYTPEGVVLDEKLAKQIMEEAGTIMSASMMGQTVYVLRYRSIRLYKEVVGVTPLTVLGLSTRPYNRLNDNGIKTVEQLLEKSEKDLVRIWEMGRKSVNEILAALKAHGLQLKQ